MMILKALVLTLIGGGLWFFFFDWLYTQIWRKKGVTPLWSREKMCGCCGRHASFPLFTDDGISAAWLCAPCSRKEDVLLVITPRGRTKLESALGRPMMEEEFAIASDYLCLRIRNEIDEIEATYKEVASCEAEIRQWSRTEIKETEQ